MVQHSSRAALKAKEAGQAQRAEKFRVPGISPESGSCFGRIDRHCVIDCVAIHNLGLCGRT
jgi:hypothetical protein